MNTDLVKRETIFYFTRGKSIHQKQLLVLPIKILDLDISPYLSKNLQRDKKYRSRRLI